MAAAYHTRRLSPPPSARRPADTLRPRDVAGFADQLSAYHAAFAPLFRRAEQRHWAKHYLAGQLLEVQRKSIEPMALALAGGNVQALKQESTKKSGVSHPRGRYIAPAAGRCSLGACACAFVAPGRSAPRVYL